MRTIAQIKTKITSRLHGTTLNKISDFYTICQDAAETMLLRVDPQETIRRTGLTNAVYDNVFEYSLPSDFKTPADLNPQANNEQVNNSLNRTYSKEFLNRKKNNQFAITWRDSVQFMKFSRFLHAPQVVDKCDSLTENGTASVGGNASNLALDTLNFVAGTGSLRADVSSSGAVVNVIMRIGNDNANYYEKTITTGHFEAFKQGWNLLRFNLSDAVLTGTVDMTTISYWSITTTYNTNQVASFERTLTSVMDLSDNYKEDGAIFTYTFFDSVTSLTLLRLDNIVASIGTLYDITYYSNYLFRTAGGVWISKPTTDTDIVNLSEVSYKIFEAEISKAIAQQVEGAMGVFDFTYWENALEGEEGLYAQYFAQFPSERIEGSTTYYDTSIDQHYGYPNIDAYEDK